VSVAEPNLLNKKPVLPPQGTKKAVFVNVEQPAYGRDIFKRIKTKDICTVTHQLATLLRAGMPLVPALRALAEQLQRQPLGEIMEQVANSVNEGSTLASAIGRYRPVFSSLFINMVAAGETSGTLEEALLSLGQMLDKRLDLTYKVKSAITYPLMMIVVATAVVVFLLSFVVPSITQIFLEMNRTLPVPTRLLIATSAFIKTYLALMIILASAGFLGFATVLRTKDYQIRWDRFKLKLPLLGKLLLKLETARLTRTLAILLTNGIDILGALEMAKGTVKNSFIAANLDTVKDSVRKGDNIASAIRKTGLFAPVVCHIITTGQISATLEDGLIHIADMYDREVDRYAKTFVSLLEPAILIVMGAVVGFIVVAILLPIFEINQAF